MKIITNHDPKPIPSRAFDWSAQTDNFDASYEGPEDGGWVTNEPTGYGATEQEAVDNLIEQLMDGERYSVLELEAARDCYWGVKRATVWDNMLNKLFGAFPK